MLRHLFRSLKKEKSLSRGALNFNCGDQQANSWNDRASISADLIAAVAHAHEKSPISIADIGCGDGKLRGFIDLKVENFSYEGFDLHPQRPDIIRLDVQTEQLGHEFDVGAMLGILEYVPDLQPSLRNLAAKCRYLVVSHACNRFGMNEEEMKKLNWTTILPKGAFEDQLRASGFAIIEDRTTANGQTVVWLCRSTIF